MRCGQEDCFSISIGDVVDEPLICFLNGDRTNCLEQEKLIGLTLQHIVFRCRPKFASVVREQFVDTDEAGKFLCLTRRRILELARARKLPAIPSAMAQDVYGVFASAKLL
jgi:hypothetical protein